MDKVGSSSLEALLEADQDFEAIGPIFAFLPALLDKFLVKILSYSKIILLSCLNHRSKNLESHRMNRTFRESITQN